MGQKKGIIICPCLEIYISPPTKKNVICNKENILTQSREKNEIQIHKIWGQLFHDHLPQYYEKQYIFMRTNIMFKYNQWIHPRSAGTQRFFLLYFFKQFLYSNRFHLVLDALSQLHSNHRINTQSHYRGAITTVNRYDILSDTFPYGFT